MILFSQAFIRPGKLTPAQRLEAAQCVNRGESPVDVARRYGITPSALRQICRVRGIGPRKSWNRDNRAAQHVG